MKLCKKCHIQYEGKQCKDCHNAASKAWELINADKRKISKRAWQKANIDKEKISIYTWRKENIIKYKTFQKEWKESNVNKIKTINKEWKFINRDKCNFSLAKRRATKLNATPKWLTEDHFKEIESFYSKAKELEELDGVKRHVDHIVPLQGKEVSGLHVPWNLRVVTAEENLSKGNKLLEVIPNVL